MTSLPKKTFRVAFHHGAPLCNGARAVGAHYTRATDVLEAVRRVCRAYPDAEAFAVWERDNSAQAAVGEAKMEREMVAQGSRRVANARAA